MHRKIQKKDALIYCFAAVTCAALPIQAKAQCDNATLSGSYHLQHLSVNAHDPNCRFMPPDQITCDAVPNTVTVKGVVSFDGAGGVVFNLVQRRVEGGSARVDPISGPGTYSVAPDCSVTLSVPTGDTVLLTTTPSGNFLFEADPPDGLRPWENFVGMGFRD